ncbi:MAG: hypothetical protein HRT37_02880 [Alteromonadaceae bacterium]|nr:hypothetical protein [Alteromonadaceae bacterium]
MINLHNIKDHYLDGQSQKPSSPEIFSVIKPATEEVITNIPAGNSLDKLFATDFCISSMG